MKYYNLIEKKLDYIVLFCYLGVNALFVYKFVPQFSFLCFVYIILLLALYVVYKKANQNQIFLSVKKYVKIFFPALFVCTILVIKFKIPALSVKVDRWSALYNWSMELMSGNYPYSAKTHLGQYASPFPIWELVHIPFYFLGDEIYAHILMVGVLFLFFRKNKERIDSVFFWLSLFFSPAYWWEVVVRSDLMNNLMICAIVIFAFEKYLKESLKPKIGFMGGFCGLLLCTRLFVIFPLGIYFFSKFMTWSWRDIVKFLLCGLIGFVLSILPFMLWNSDMFIWFKYSPIHLQTQFGNPILAVLGILLLFLFSFLWENFRLYLGIVTIVLFGFILLRFFQEVKDDGWYSSIFLDSFDISYFNVCLPFALFYLAYNKNLITNKEL